MENGQRRSLRALGRGTGRRELFWAPGSGRQLGAERSTLPDALCGPVLDVRRAEVELASGQQRRGTIRSSRCCASGSRASRPEAAARITGIWRLAVIRRFARDFAKAPRGADSSRSGECARTTTRTWSSAPRSCWRRSPETSAARVGGWRSGAFAALDGLRDWWACRRASAILEPRLDRCALVLGRGGRPTRVRVDVRSQHHLPRRPRRPGRGRARGGARGSPAPARSGSVPRGGAVARGTSPWARPRARSPRSSC